LAIEIYTFMYTHTHTHTLIVWKDNYVHIDSPTCRGMFGRLEVSNYALLCLLEIMLAKQHNCILKPKGNYWWVRYHCLVLLGGLLCDAKDYYAAVLFLLWNPTNPKRRLAETHNGIHSQTALHSLDPLLAT
jgi:hypothetical protein